MKKFYLWILYPVKKSSNYVTWKNLNSFWNFLVVNFLTALFLHFEQSTIALLKFVLVKKVTIKMYSVWKNYVLRWLVSFRWKSFLLVIMNNVPYYLKELWKIFQKRIAIFNKCLLVSRNQVKCHRNRKPRTVFPIIYGLKSGVSFFPIFVSVLRYW